MSTRFAIVIAVLAATLLHATPASATSGTSIAALAIANLGKGACSATSLGGDDFGSSCTGNGGYPEYWCADFALWVWASAGVTDVAGLDAAAGSFYVYGQDHGTLSDTPAVGDAVVFDYAGGGVADHVAIVTQVNADGSIESVSGDWGGSGSTEAAFASTSSVVHNTPAYSSTVGTAPSIMGMTISGYVSPVGLGFDFGAAFVSQSFPLASTALTMTAGQTLPASIVLQNTGTVAWNTSTHLGTTQPRDRASVFADATWLATNRPAGVSGSIAPGDSYTFTFDLHAPSEAGTYFEYFNVVQEGVAWFSDPGQGGPSDDDLEVQIVVVDAKAPSAPIADAGADASDGGAVGAAAGDAGSDDASSAAPTTSGNGGSASAGSIGAAPVIAIDGDASAANGASTTSDSDARSSAGGCAISGGTTGSGDLGWMVGGLGWLVRRRRRGGRTA